MAHAFLHRPERITRCEDALELGFADPPARLRISAPLPGVLRLQLGPGDRLPAPPPGLLAADAADARLEVDEGDGGLRLSSPPLAATLATAPLRLDLALAGGRPLGGLHPEGGLFLTPGGAVGIRLALDEGEGVYGLGEKVGGLDRRGRSYAFWNTDVTPHLPDTDPLYVSVPFWLTLRPGPGGAVATGWFVLAPGRSQLDAGAGRPDRLTVTVERGGLDLFVLAGPTPAEVLARYTALTGRAPLPPLWALGHQHSRWGHGSAANLLRCAAGFRERRIPCDVLYLDIDHMDGYRVFTWDPARFPDPEGLAEELKGMGYRLVTIVDPGVKSDPDFTLYREGLESDHFVLTPAGAPLFGDVWPGRCAFPDFLRPETRRWWGEHVRRHAARGVDGIWNDMNEPAVFGPAGTGTFPPDAVHRPGDGVPRAHAEVHNLYGLEMARATYEALHRPGGPRPFILTRSGFAGVQRFAAVWTGDNSSWWEHLQWMIPMLAGLGLSGVPFVGVDVGGFGGDVEPELFARWVQAAALTPLFRNHSAWNTRRQEPWCFGPEVEETARQAIGLRYRLLPYLYQAFAAAHRTGAPVLRPLLYAHPDDPDARAVEDQYLVGDDLLVAPVLQRGARRRLVYLPDGEWVRLPEGRRLRGPGWHVAEAGLRELPLFARAGAVLPLWPVAESTARVDRSLLELEVVAADRGAERALYADDGETTHYESGEWSQTPVRHGPDRGGYAVELGPPEGAYPPPWRRAGLRLWLPPGTAPAEVLWNGRALPRDAGLAAESGLAPRFLAIGAAPVPDGEPAWGADAERGLVVIRFPRGDGVDRVQVRFS